MFNLGHGDVRGGRRDACRGGTGHTHLAITHCSQGEVGGFHPRHSYVGLLHNNMNIRGETGFGRWLRDLHRHSKLLLLG